ncbi:hypothetical protein NH340_JMT04187 [Sarcoptes scabiei]|nr:hypothetical protein NH340_JMT04187 [Sarcoptes scabiei]
MKFSSALQSFYSITLLISIQFHFANAFLEGLYCGLDNCYDVLNLTRDATREQISRSYRSLARKWHPDLHRGAEQKAEATIKFQLIAQAYEVLRDDESRKDYDYLLDNPEAYYAHYYRYYRRVYAPKVDVRIVIVVAISLISIYQYYAYNSRYKEAIDYFLTIPKYRIQAKEIAIDEGIWPTMNHTSNGKLRLKQRGSGNKQKLKDELKQEEENCLRKIIEEKMDIKGVYSKPTYKDILWIQLFLLPWFLIQYILWYARWIYKFNIRKEPYGIEEKHYLMRKFMGLSESQWSQKDDFEIEEYMREELWIKENFDPWKKEKDDEMRAKLAENPSYKRYRRYMKKGGPGQITFLDD